MEIQILKTYIVEGENSHNFILLSGNSELCYSFWIYKLVIALKHYIFCKINRSQD